VNGAAIRFEWAVQLGIRKWARSKIRELRFQSPMPQVVRIESDAKEVAGQESEFRRSQSDDADDDAICSGNHPSLPEFLPDEDRREDRQHTRQIIKPQHFLFPPRTFKHSIHLQFKGLRGHAKLVRRTGATNFELRFATQDKLHPCEHAGP
jgi:hypothetical protein